MVVVFQSFCRYVAASSKRYRGGRLVLVSHLGRPEGQAVAECTLRPCAKRLAELLARFPADDREHMAKEDGSIEMTCEYCKREWRFTAEETDSTASAND